MHLSSIFAHSRRAIAQKCPNPPMLNLISVGGQHQGNKEKKQTCLPFNQLCLLRNKVANLHVIFSQILIMCAIDYIYGRSISLNYQEQM